MKKVEYPRVLICAPTSDKKAYCDKDYFSMIRSLSYPNSEILVADNSDTPHYYNKIKNEYKIPCIRVNPKGKTAYQFITESYQALVKEAMRRECYYIMVIESDVFVPTANIIQRLMSHDKPVVSGIYPVGNGANSYFLLQQLEKDVISEKSFHVPNLTNGNDLLFIDGTLKPIFSCGLGCTLIRIDVFARIPFRYVEGAAYWNDTYFYIDLFMSDIQAYVDTSVICSHKNQDWSMLDQLRNQQYGDKYSDLKAIG